MAEPLYTSVILDWKQFSDEAYDELEKALQPFGLILVSNPAFDDTDTYGFAICKAGDRVAVEKELEAELDELE